MDPGSLSSPGNQLAFVYKKYLADFDIQYIRNLLDRKRMGQQPQSSAPFGQVNVVRQLLSQNPQPYQEMVKLSGMSSAELRAQGYADQMINFIETHRAVLLQTAQSQENFRASVAPKAQMNGPRPLAQPTPMAPASFAPTQTQPLVPSSMARPPQLVPQLAQAPAASGPSLSAAPMPDSNPQQPAVQITKEYVEALIRRLRDELTAAVTALAINPLPPNQRAGFAAHMQQACAYVADIEPRLMVWFDLTQSEDLLRRLMVLVRFSSLCSLIFIGPLTFYTIRFLLYIVKGFSYRNYHRNACSLHGS